MRAEWRGDNRKIEIKFVVGALASPPLYLTQIGGG